MGAVSTAVNQRSQLARAAAPQRALAEAVDAGKVSMSAILRAVGIDPNNATHQAALLACERYELDPLLKHIVVIPQAGPYITRDGWLHVAHRSGAFDGMEVVETGEDDGHWIAKVAVYRKDMGRPFSYVGRYPKAGSNKKYGPEMAVKVAEVAALRRAFPISGIGAYEERWDEAIDVDDVQPTHTPVVEPDDSDIIDAETLDLNPEGDAA